ncbi:MarR family transcriptional regulator [bacterium]|nr:MarR family transcriptional regulator [bacterium]
MDLKPIHPAGILDLGNLLREVQDLEEAMRALTADLLEVEDLTAGQRSLLVELRRGPARTMARLARDLGQSRQHVRAVIHPLAERGLAGFRENPDNRRSPLVELTPGGIGTVRRILHREGEILAGLAPRMESAGLKTARGVLAGLREMMEARRG